ncbi:hypothetical protein K8R78_07445 [bacterium]|nr:hypothetical protein [bacterium]
MKIQPSCKNIRLLWGSLLALLFFSTPVVADSTIEESYAALPTVELTLRGDGKSVEFALPQRGILLGSETVLLVQEDGTATPLAPLIDYRLDYDNGRLILLSEPLPPSRSLRVSYRYLPLAAESLVQEAEGQRNLFSRQGEYVGKGDRIEISGSKGVGLKLSSGSGLGVVQSLDVALSGELASGLRFEGVLSDQDLPVTVAGTTAELEELDEIRLSAWTETFRLDLGDYQLTPTGERYGPGARSLEGIQLGLDLEEWGISALYSQPRGLLHSQRFTPTPAVLGPYQLLGRNGESNIIVIPGSEQVYLDGEPLTRGSKADYTIDYAIGQLTFNLGIPLTQSSEVLARFSYTSLGYRRSLYGGRTRLGAEGASLNLAYYHEGDDKENDLWGLSDADRTDLRQAGDEPLERELTGEYDFEYVGEGNGTHELTYNPATGQYSFEESPGGAYRRRRWQLPAPESHGLLLLSGRFISLDNLSLKGELALSDYDANLFSSLHDADNAALAFHGELDWRLPLGLNGDTLSLSLSGERREASFRALRPFESSPSEHRNWNYDPATRALRELVSGRLSYGFSFGPTVFLGGGGLWLTNETEPWETLKEPGWRRSLELSTGLDWKRPVGLSYRYLRQSGEQLIVADDITPAGPTSIQIKTELHEATLTPDLGILQPRLGLLHSDEPDYKHHRYSGGLTLFPEEPLTLDYDLRYNRESGVVNVGTLTHLVGLTWQPESWFYLNTTYSHESELDKDETTDGGELRLDLTPWRGGVALSLNYELGRSWSYPLLEQYVYAADGNGSWRREEDPDDPTGWIYIFDPGDPEAFYERRLLPAGEPLRSINAAASASLKLTPRSIFKEDWAKLFELELSASFNDEGEGESTLDRALFQKILTNSSRYGNLQTSVRLVLWPTASWGRLTPSFHWNSGRDRRIHPRDEAWGEREYALDLRVNLSDNLRLLASGSFEQEWRRGALSYFGANDSDRQLTRNRAWLEPRLVSGAWRPRLRLGWELSQQDSVGGHSTLTTIELTPTLLLHLGELGSLELSYRWRQHSLSGPPTTESLLYRRPGTDHRWQATLNSQLDYGLSLRFSYIGEAEPNRETVHRGEASAGLFF